MKMQKNIKTLCKKQSFIKITRKVGKDWYERNNGYIVDFSKKFIVVQECYDFKLMGFILLPVKDLEKICHNKYDKSYEKIMLLENETKNLALKTKLDLTDWQTVFQSLQKKKKNVIVECESPKIQSFTIGAIKKITNKSVFIHHFDATGLLDKKPTEIKFKNISKVTFDDRYVDVFSKYIRKRKK